VEVLAIDGDIVRLEVVATSDDAREGVVQALVEARLGVRRVIDAGGGLESVFLKLTRPAANASGGDA
jgi:hypothetical protein